MPCALYYILYGSYYMLYTTYYLMYELYYILNSILEWTCRYPATASVVPISVDNGSYLITSLPSLIFFDILFRSLLIMVRILSPASGLEGQIRSFPRFGNSDPKFSKVWRVRSLVFRGLEGQILSFPRFGGADLQFSEVWKVRSSVFRRLEGQILSFPRFGWSDPQFSGV